MTTPAATDDELLALPPLFGVSVAAAHLQLSESGFYTLLRTGKLPIPVVRLGSRIKVRRCDLLEFLGIAAQAA